MLLCSVTLKHTHTHLSASGFFQAERARKGAENELTDANDRVNELSAQVSSFSGQKRKLEADINAMQTDLDEMNGELRGAEDRAKKAMADAARLADELRQEQEHSLQVRAELWDSAWENPPGLLVTFEKMKV